MANDRKEEAWELIQKAAQMNGKPLTKDLEMCQVGIFHYLLVYGYFWFTALFFSLIISKCLQ